MNPLICIFLKIVILKSYLLFHNHLLLVLIYKFIFYFLKHSYILNFEYEVLCDITLLFVVSLDSHSGWSFLCLRLYEITLFFFPSFLSDLIFLCLYCPCRAQVYSTPSNFTQGKCPYKNLHMKFPDSIIHYSQKTETSQMLTNWWVNK